MGQPRPLFCLFSVFFKQTLQFLQQINVKKCPSSIRRRDSNPRPLDREPPPITTRPGLPPPDLTINHGQFTVASNLVIQLPLKEASSMTQLSKA